jgi:hypothetical protein
MTRGKLIVLVATLFLAVGVSADTLKLRSGETVQGVFLGADSSQVTFQAPNKQPATYHLVDVSGATFAALDPAAPPPPPTKAMNATLLVGAMIPVQIITGLSSEQSRAGDITATLDSNLMAGNVVMARAGLGAIIGSFGGNAGKGAAIGVVAGGGVSMTTKEKSIRFPSETLLQFSLSRPTAVPVQC